MYSLQFPLEVNGHVNSMQHLPINDKKMFKKLKEKQKQKQNRKIKGIFPCPKPRPSSPETLTV